MNSYRQYMELYTIYLAQMQASNIRLAKHAGSWYEKQKDTLSKTLDRYIQQAQCLVKKWNSIKAVIAPHAGYAYSGPTAGWAYKYLKQQQNSVNGQTRVFLLGPSHKKYIEGCSISICSQLQTPLGNLTVDTQQIKVLESKGKFKRLTKKEEENEHSLQMHMPFIYKVYGAKAKVIPIIVGQNNQKMIDDYGKLFATYYDQKDTVFVISSDFCHWGPDFDYQPYKQGEQIWKHIEKLDRQGMDIIEKNDLKQFHNYMQNTGNTICGQQPIRLLMSTIKHSKTGSKTQFVQYAQSGKVTDFNDSSVSYASSISFIVE